MTRSWAVVRTHLLVLASGPRGGVGVDLATGALLRARWADPPAPASLVSVYDVLEVDAHGDERLPFPRDSVVARVCRQAGRMRGRRAEKLLRPLEHPVSQPLLGGATAAVPYWTMSEHDAGPPSVALVAPSAGPVVERDAALALRCRFRWRRLDHDLPFADPVADERLAHPTAAVTRLAGGTLARALGWKPHRLVIALAEPEEGVCQKVVAAIVPKP